MSSIAENVNAEIKKAMLAKNQMRLDTLRSIRAGILEFEKNGSGKELTDEETQKIILSGVKKRKDAIEQYEAHGRTEQAQKEKDEMAILYEFLPKQLSESEVEDVVRKIIADTGAAGADDFKKVIGPAMKELKGKADGGMVQATVKKLLS